MWNTEDRAWFPGRSWKMSCLTHIIWTTLPLITPFWTGFKRKILAAGSSLTRADIKSHQLIGLPFLPEPFFANEKRNEGHRFTPLRSGFSSRNYINSIPAARSWPRFQLFVRRDVQGYEDKARHDPRILSPSIFLLSSSSSSSSSSSNAIQYNTRIESVELENTAMRLKQPTSECRRGNKFLAWNIRGTIVWSIRFGDRHPSACQSGIESFSRGWDHAWTRPRFKRRRTRVQICLPTVAYRRDSRGFSWVVTLFDAGIQPVFSGNGTRCFQEGKRLKFAVIIIL